MFLLNLTYHTELGSNLREAFFIGFFCHTSIHVSPFEVFTFCSSKQVFSSIGYTIVEELVPKLLGLGEIQKVLQNLLTEGVSIRDLLTIFEALADHATVTRDTDLLTEYVRQTLKRAISNKYFGGNGQVSVLTLDPKVEQEIMGSVKQSEQGAYITLSPDRIKAIVDNTRVELEKMENAGTNPIVLTSPIVRMYYRKLMEDYFKDLIVISYNEVSSDVELQSLGMITA